MKLCELIDLNREQILLEGGSALKSSKPVTQTEAKKLIPFLIDRVSTTLNVSKSRVKALGSAGNKPHPEDESGDIDLAVEAEASKVEAALKELSHDGKTFRAMKGINVYSFGAEINGKVVQVDLVPVADVKYAEWAFQAHPKDLSRELKGAHRNEVFFAVAKHAHHKVLKKDEEGKPLEVERYFYDLSRGLMKGIQSRQGKKRAKKNFSTIQKEVVSRDPKKIVKLLFGNFKPEDVSTFSGALAAVNSKMFNFPEHRDKIISMIKVGIQKKGLVLPKELR